MKIDTRLFDRHGIDTNKNLNINTVCSRPFDTLLIDKNGQCFLCECTSWLPQSVGNLQIHSIDEILTSKLSEKIRESVSNKKYNFCNDKQCAYIKSKKIVPKTTVDLKYLRLAIDDSCNLRCPSCRQKKVFIRSGNSFKRRLKMAEKILQYLNTIDHDIIVHVGSDGDPFASLVYRYILKNFPKKENIRFNLQTNGLLLEKFHRKNKSLFQQLDTLNISIDGATKDVYEKLRLGGQWEQIYSNLQYLASEKKNFRVNLHMVVQQDNWHQMQEILDLADRFKFDQVFFNPISDWNTGLDFSKQTFHLTKEFKEEISIIRKHDKAKLWLLS